MKAAVSLAMAASLPLAAPAAADAPLSPWEVSQQFNARLLAASTATAALHQWCADHGAADPTIRAEVITTRPRPASAAQRARLGVTRGAVLGYRRVRLHCGATILSVAENWYVVDRLSAAMRATLATTDTPFGTVIAPLHPHRHNLGVEMLWRGGEAPPTALFRHRALVLDGDGQPIAEVLETYQRAALELR